MPLGEVLDCGDQTIGSWDGVEAFDVFPTIRGRFGEDGLFGLPRRPDIVLRAADKSGHRLSPSRIIGWIAIGFGQTLVSLSEG